MKLPPTVLIEDTNFHNAYARAVRTVIRDGIDIVIGDISEPKPIRDACMTISLTGNAITQIENRSIHDQYPFRHIDQYCEEFTRPYLDDYVNLPDEQKFSYLYFERIVMYDPPVPGIPRPFDQLNNLRRDLSLQIINDIPSNQSQSITWYPDDDNASTSPPCLQRIWIRMLSSPRCGDCGKVEVHITWRSRDLFHAWQSNMIAIIQMLNTEVMHPNGCCISKIVDFNDSLHIYHHSMEQAKQVKLVKVNPQTRR